MRKFTAGMFLGLMFLAIGTYNSYAEMCGCMDKMGEGMHGGGMHKMEGMKHRPMMEAHQRVLESLKDLNLDDNQKETIRGIKTRIQKDTITKRADIKIARIDLHDMLHKDPVDMKAVEGKLRQLEAMRTDLRLSHIKAFEEIKSKLTLEQRTKFMSNMGKHKRGEHDGKGMHGHGHEEQKG